jgi:hypothetical protein
LQGLLSPFQSFHGTKLAQRNPAFIETNRVFLQSAHPHNLKVVGSNPTPATRKTGRSGGYASSAGFLHSFRALANQGKENSFKSNGLEDDHRRGRRVG